MWMKKEGTDELKVKSSKVKPSNGEITRRVRRLPLRSDRGCQTIEENSTVNLVKLERQLVKP